MNIAVIGAGNRARKYLGCLPEGVHVRCLVEPDPLRLRQTAARFGVAPDGCFSSPDDFFASVISSVVERSVDAVIIAAPDRLHVPLALRCVERGWPVLLEKPAAPTESAYRSLLAASERSGVPVALCLEMRFHPYFRRIKELTAMLGRLREIDHTEHIGPDRMAHTFVRGLWSRRADAGPIFLSKCCHDADFLFWITGALSAGPVRSRGSRTKFRPSGAPDGATARCFDCPLASSCPYSAVTLYRERGEWTDGFDVPEGRTLADVIETELRTGRYGRCVYHCNNTVFDEQEVTTTLTVPSFIPSATSSFIPSATSSVIPSATSSVIPSATSSVIPSATSSVIPSATSSVIPSAVEGSVSLRMRLEGMSLQEGRTTLLRGDAGILLADAGRIRVWYGDSLPLQPDGMPAGAPSLDEDYSALEHLPLHAGADEALVRDFFEALAAGRKPAADLASSFAAHRLCFLAG